MIARETPTDALNNCSQLDTVAVGNSLFISTHGLVEPISRARDALQIDNGFCTYLTSFSFSRKEPPKFILKRHTSGIISTNSGLPGLFDYISHAKDAPIIDSGVCTYPTSLSLPEKEPLNSESLGQTSSRIGSTKSALVWTPSCHRRLYSSSRSSVSIC